MSANGCDYYKAIKKDIQNCPNCTYWGGSRCQIEQKVLSNNKSDLVHEAVGFYRPAGSRITGVLK